MRQFCKSLFPVVEYAYCTIPTYPSGQIGFMLCSKNPVSSRHLKCPLPFPRSLPEAVPCRTWAVALSSPSCGASIFFHAACSVLNEVHNTPVALEMVIVFCLVVTNFPSRSHFQFPEHVKALAYWCWLLQSYLLPAKDQPVPVNLLTEASEWDLEVKMWAGNSVRPLKFALFPVCFSVIVRWVWGAAVHV